MAAGFDNGNFNEKKTYDDEINKLLGPSEDKIKKTMNNKLKKKQK